MGKTGLTVGVHIEGLTQTMAAFRRLPKEASDALRNRSLEIAEALAGKVAAAARTDSGQSALMAPTVKAVRDRIPAITAGGAKKVGRNRKPAYKILFGSEFGAMSLPQFRPHLGQGSYWMFRTVAANESEISRTWLKAADDVVRAFGEGG